MGNDCNDQIALVKLRTSTMADGQLRPMRLWPRARMMASNINSFTIEIDRFYIIMASVSLGLMIVTPFFVCFSDFLREFSLC